MLTYLAYASSAEFLDAFWEIVIAPKLLTVTHGVRGCVGHTKTHRFNNEEGCYTTARQLMEEQRLGGYVFVGSPRLKTHSLPELLNKEEYLTHDIPDITCHDRPEIKHISVVIGRAVCERGIAAIIQKTLDTYAAGVFCATAYTLAERGPEKLVWLPKFDGYCLWNEHTRQLFSLDDVRPDQLRHRLRRLFNVYATYPEVMARYPVWMWFDFIPESLPDEATGILCLPDEDRVGEAEIFIARYEARLLYHPFCNALESAYRALVKVYNYLGQHHEEQAEYARAAEYLERAAYIIQQSPEYRGRIFIHTFLQLSFCYMELSAFDMARLNIDTYAVYDPSARGECEQIRASIDNTQKLYDEAMEACRRTLGSGTPQEYEEAIRITLLALQHVPNDAMLHFNLACFYSVVQNLDQSLKHLELAFQKGFQNDARLFNDEDLENVRLMPEFADMMIHYVKSVAQ